MAHSDHVILKPIWAAKEAQGQHGQKVKWTNRDSAKVINVLKII